MQKLNGESEHMPLISFHLPNPAILAPTSLLLVALGPVLLRRIYFLLVFEANRAQSLISERGKKSFSGASGSLLQLIATLQFPRPSTPW